MTVWLNVKGEPGYQVSSDGEIKNIKSGRILKTHLNRPGGVKRVTMNGKHKYVHRVVADTFFAVGVEKSSKVVHIDGNNLNNKVSNLQIVE